MLSTIKHQIVFWGILFCLSAVFFAVQPQVASAVNIKQYKDVLSDSGPSEQSNHTFSFTINTALSAGSEIEITPPSGFTIISTSTFAVRNVELRVNGSVRTSSSTASVGVDQVDIIAGSPGFIRYTLAPDFSIAAGSQLELRVGNHTNTALFPVTSFSTTTGTTTTQGDIEPIINSSVLGAHDVQMEIYDGVKVASTKFLVFLNQKVTMPNVDTTEEFPPVRFNPAPTTTIGGTTLNVEISLETDEFAVCRYSTSAGVAYSSMPNTFSSTGFVFHSTIVSVIPDSIQTFYVRCVDDEGNFNIDDFLITFSVNDTPEGTPNEDGDVEGDGTGSGNDGTGTGSGDGGTTGDSDGDSSSEGGSSGGGGGGGSGGGGGQGDDDGSTSGGGFGEDAPYRSGDGRVIISGNAYPNSTVGILVDGNFYQTVSANGTGVFSITLDEIARGVYTFGVYAEDKNDVKSSTFSTSFTVTGARTSSLGNINIAPSILVTPDPVDPGETVTFSGYAIPSSDITIENGKINRAASQSLTAVADASGKWSIEVDTTGFSVSTYQVRAKAVQAGGGFTNFSEYTFYGVGQTADVPINADLNRDGKVNLIDFSILLFWWGGNGGDSDPPADINQDGNVSLTDFSILLFNWTG